MTNTITAVAKPYSNLTHMQANAADHQNPNDPTQQSPVDQQNAQGAVTDQATSGNNNTDEDTYFHRWKNLKKYHDTEIHKARQRVKELEQEMSTSTNSTPPKTTAELEAFRNSNPDLYDNIASMSHTAAASVDQVSATRLAALEAELAEVRAEKAMVAVQSKHQDAPEVLASPQFNHWLGTQGGFVQDMVTNNTNDASALIRAIDLYKFDNMSNNMPSSTEGFSNTNVGSQTQSSAADAVNTRGGNVNVTGDSNKRVWTREEISKMGPDEFLSMEKEIMEAHLEGRVR